MGKPYLQARPTVYRGIQMRSRLEATWAAWLDELGTWRWEYEPCCFADGGAQYLPDFRLYGEGDGEPTYLEVKGLITDLDAEMARMEVILASEPLAALWLAEGKPLRCGGTRDWMGIRWGRAFYWTDTYEEIDNEDRFEGSGLTTAMRPRLFPGKGWDLNPVGLDDMWYHMRPVTDEERK